MTLDIETMDQRVAVLEQEATAVVVVDDVTRMAADLVVGKLKDAAKEIDEEREAVCRPLLDELEEKRAPRIKAVALLTSIRKALEHRVGMYVEQRRRIEAEAAQKAIAEANRKRAEEEAKAEAARKAAAEAAAVGNAIMAAKLEAKAEKAEWKAATVVAVPVATTAKSTFTDDGRSLTTKSTPDWMLGNWDKTGKLYADDASLVGLDLSKYRRFFVLDVSRVNRAVSAGETLPSPFQMTVKYGSVQRKQG